MGISQTILIIGIFFTPYVIEMLVRIVGFRNTLWSMTGLAVILFFTIGVLHPVEWHMQKVIVENEKIHISEYIHFIQPAYNCT